MMRIALVDDDAKFLAQTARLLEFVLEQRRERAAVAMFASAEELLAAKPGEAFDLYLLDVVMPGMSGIELARRIRRNQPDAPVVFFTTSPEFALESYSVRAADYVVKPFTHDAFARAFDEAFRRLAAVRPRGVVLKTPEGLANLPLRDLEAETMTFVSSRDLLSARNDGSRYDIYLLEAMLPKMDGVALGLKIRETQADASIVYVTRSAEWANASFAVSSIGYLLKPCDYEVFAATLDRACRMLPIRAR